MMSQRNPSDPFELADKAWSWAEDVLSQICGPSELFGELANWDGATIGSDLS